MVNLTCIVLNYNDAPTTVELISKIKTYDTVDKIVIVDNSSTDDSYEILSSIHDSKIILIQTDHNGGYGFGNNIGIKYAYGVLNSAYVLIVNPDIIIKEEVIQKLLYDLSVTDAALITAIMLDNNNKPVMTGWKVPSFFEYVLATSTIMNYIFNPIKFINYTNCGVISVGCVTGACFLARTEKLYKYGLFDEDIFLYCEETVLGIKMKNSNQLVLLDTDVSFIHNHSVSIKKSIKKETHRFNIFLTSKEKVLDKYYRPNKINRMFANLFLKYCRLENKIINKMKELKR